MSLPFRGISRRQSGEVGTTYRYQCSVASVQRQRRHFSDDGFAAANAQRASRTERKGNGMREECGHALLQLRLELGLWHLQPFPSLPRSLAQTLIQVLPEV